MQTKSKIYFIIGIFVVIAGLMVALVIWPLLRGISAKATEILLTKAKAASFESQNKELEIFKSKYPGYGPGLEKISDMFINAKNPVAFIEFLEQTGRELGVEVSVNITPPGKDAASLAVAPFQIAAKGSFAHVVRFADVLENGGYLTTIRNVTITPFIEILADKTASPKDIVTANFLIEVATK